MERKQCIETNVAQLKYIVAVRLKGLMHTYELNSRSLAALSTEKGCPVSQPTIYRMLHAQSAVNAKALVSLAYTLDCSLDWLCGRTDFSGVIRT